MNDKDLEITHPTWGILFVSFLGLFLELLFIRWIGTEIRIFAYLQNTILVVCFLGLGLGMFTSSKPIRIRQTLVPMVILMLLMALPITRFPMGRISEMLSVLGDFVIWSRPASGDTGTIITLLSIGLCLTYVLLVFVVDIFVPIGRLLGRLMDAHPNPIWAYSVNIFGSIIGTWAFVLLSFYYQTAGHLVSCNGRDHGLLHSLDKDRHETEFCAACGHHSSLMVCEQGSREP